MFGANEGRHLSTSVLGNHVDCAIWVHSQFFLNEAPVYQATYLPWRHFVHPLMLLHTECAKSLYQTVLLIKVITNRDVKLERSLVVFSLYFFSSVHISFILSHLEVLKSGFIRWCLGLWKKYVLSCSKSCNAWLFNRGVKILPCKFTGTLRLFKYKPVWKEGDLSSGM